MARLAIGMCIAVIGLVVLLMPKMMRPGILFAVPVTDDFRWTPIGRRIVATYQVWVALGLALAFLPWLVSPASSATEFAPLALLMISGSAFYLAHQKVKPFAVKKSTGPRSVEMTAAPERLPRWTWFAVGPLVVLALAGIFLSYHWGNIPAKFPVHFDGNDVPDRWAVKSLRSVYGPLLFGGEICTYLAAMGITGWYGARRSDFRSRILGLMLVTEYLLALVFAAIAVQPELAFPAWVIMVPVLCVPVLFIAFVLYKSGEPSDPPEKTPDECWKGGLIYYNPNDPVLFVEKRVGYGYTVNFGNRWSWALVSAMTLVLGTAPFLLA